MECDVNKSDRLAIGLRFCAIPRVLHGVQLLKSQPFIKSNASEIDISFMPCQRSVCSFS